jgi:hypothetical protein
VAQLDSIQQLRVPAARKAVYLSALKKVDIQGGLSRHDEKVIGAFDKKETHVYSGKAFKSNRHISPSQPEYNVELFQYTVAVQQAVDHLMGDGSFWPRNRLTYCFDQYTLYDNFKVMWDETEDPVQLELDQSGFDVHVQRDMYDLFISFMLSLFPKANRKHLKKLLQAAYSSKHEEAFATFEIQGQLQSGRPITSLVAKFIMIVCLRAALGPPTCSTGRVWSLISAGDDTSVICNSKFANGLLGDFKQEGSLSSFFYSCGFELKVVSINRKFNQIKFCQMSPCLDRFVRNPVRVLSKLCGGSKFYGTVEHVRKMLFAIGQCEMAYASGIPVLQNLALRLMAQGIEDANYVTEELQRRHMFNFSPRPPVSIIPEARAQFFDAFGLDLSVQMLLEHELDSCIFNPSIDVTYLRADPTDIVFLLATGRANGVPH